MLRRVVVLGHDRGRLSRSSAAPGWGAGSTCAGSPCGCAAGEILDCFGNCAPASWVGDGICDDGSRTWNGNPIFLDCVEHGDDGGDCVVPVDLVNLADADFETQDGSILSGSYLDTHDQDDVGEVLRERRTGGQPANRRSLLSHTWRFIVTPGTAYEFRIDAHHSANNEGDDFVFSYSLDNATYTPMVTVTKTSDDDGVQTYAFPGDVGGIVFIRVEDTDRTAGNGNRDTVTIDEMSIVTTVDGPDLTPPAPPSGVAANSGDGVVDLDWNDNAEPDLAGLPRVPIGDEWRSLHAAHPRADRLQRLQRHRRRQRNDLRVRHDGSRCVQQREWRRARRFSPRHLRPASRRRSALRRSM